MSVVVTESPALHFPFGKQREENGPKHVNSSSDTEDSLPFPNSVIRGQTFSNDGSRHPGNSGKRVCDAQEDASIPTRLKILRTLIVEKFHLTLK